MCTTSVINQTNATAIINKLGRNFDSHAFIRKFMELYPEEYGEMLRRHRCAKTANGEISSYLSKNAPTLKIKKIGNIKSLNVFLRFSPNALWAK